MDARLDELEKQAAPLADELPVDTLLWNDKVEEFGVATNARVVAFRVLGANPPALAVVADSRRGESSRDVARNPTALRAAETGRVERGRVVTVSGDFAEVAVPRGEDAVVLFRASLADSLATVRLVERRLLVATGSPCFSRWFSALPPRGCSRTACVAWRPRQSGLPAVTSTRRSSTAAMTRSASWRPPSIGCASSSRSSTTRGRSSSANASHELRTPLFSIGGFLELLTDEELDEETRDEFLSTMRSQVERLTKLSTDLLDLSRMDAGQLRVEREPVDLSSVVATLARELEHVAEASGHVLDTELDGSAWCTADEERVLQIGRALVVNGLVHTPAGTRLVVRARRRGSRAELEVADDGPGIPPEQREAVFERFYRVEGGVASGSGLGLAIAREVARLMDGGVRLESAPGTNGRHARSSRNGAGRAAADRRVHRFHVKTVAPDGVGRSTIHRGEWTVTRGRCGRGEDGGRRRETGFPTPRGRLGDACTWRRRPRRPSASFRKGTRS